MCGRQPPLDRRGTAPVHRLLSLYLSLYPFGNRRPKGGLIKPFSAQKRRRMSATDGRTEPIGNRLNTDRPTSRFESGGDIIDPLR